MAEPPDPLSDFHGRSVVLTGVGRRVFVSGSGPAVVLLAATDADVVIRAARRLRSVQFTTFVLREHADTSWVRALARAAHAECGDPGVGFVVPEDKHDLVADVADESCVCGVFVIGPDAAAAWARVEQDLVAFFRARLYPPQPFTPESVI
jgi:hypothetical protein